MNTLIQCSNLCKSFKKEKVIDNLNINVYEGDSYGFLGPKGSGKSITIKMILGLVKPSKGSIYIDGFDVFKDRDKAIEKIGATIETPSFYPYLSAYRNLMLYANLYGLKKERVFEVIEMVGLSESKDKKVGKYSLGMKQRLGIARAFINKPKIVILDEPTNGLDPQGVIGIRNLIRYLKEKEEITFILCSHVLSEVKTLCNRVSLIHKGEILAEGEVEKVLTEDTETLIIQTSDRDKVKEAAISAANIKSITYITEGLQLTCSKGDCLEINKKLVLENIQFTEIKKKEISLEDFFIKKLENDKKYA